MIARVAGGDGGPSLWYRSSCDSAARMATRASVGLGKVALITLAVRSLWPSPRGRPLLETLRDTDLLRMAAVAALNLAPACVLLRAHLA